MHTKKITSALLWLGNIAGLAILLAVAPDGMAKDIRGVASDPWPAQERWVVSDLAADNGLTVAVEVGNVAKLGAIRRTSIALLDGIIFTDPRLTPEVRVRIEHDCAAARTTVLDYLVAQYGQKAVFSKEQGAIQRKGAMAGRYVERLSPVAEDEVHQVLCKGVAPDQQQFGSIPDALAQALGTDRANYPPVALERAQRVIHDNALVVDRAMDEVHAGSCQKQRNLPSIIAKRDRYLWKLTEFAHRVSDRGLHVGPRASYGADDVLWLEVEAVGWARECLGDTSPLPAQGVRIPDAFMPLAE